MGGTACGAMWGYASKLGLLDRLTGSKLTGGDVMGIDLLRGLWPDITWGILSEANCGFKQVEEIIGKSGFSGFTPNSHAKIFLVCGVAPQVLKHHSNSWGLAEPRPGDGLVEMGLTSVKTRVINPYNPGLAGDVELLVDTGSVLPWIPRETLEKIGLKPEAKKVFRTIEGEKFGRLTTFARIKQGDVETFVEVVMAEEGGTPVLVL